MWSLKYIYSLALSTWKDSQVMTLRCNEGTLCPGLDVNIIFHQKGTRFLGEWLNLGLGKKNYDTNQKNFISLLDSKEKLKKKKTVLSYSKDIESI